MRHWRIAAFGSCALFAACAGQPKDSPAMAGAKATIYSKSLHTWFEEVGGHFRLSPDARLAIFEIRGDVRLVDLSEGQGLNDRLGEGLDTVRDAVFDSSGRLVRLGEKDGARGWFAEGPDPERLEIPADARPIWSPDGAQVAYTRRSRPRGVFAGAIGTERFHPIAKAGRVSGLAWSADTDALFVVLAEESGSASLYRLRLDSGAQERLAQGLDIAGLDARNLSSSVAVPPDGKRVILSLAGPGPPDREARHQPHADRDLDLYSIALETGDRALLAGGPGDDFQPRWRGDSLYWMRNEIRDEAVLVPVEGGEARVLVEGAQMPYWHPDGRRISFTDGGWRLADWALNLDAATLELDDELRPASKPEPLINGYHEDFSGVFSPDGRWVAYHSHRSDQAISHYAAQGATDDIYLRPAADGPESETRLTDFGWEVGNPDWSPDSRRLVFTSWEREDPGASRCYTVAIDPESGQPEQVQRLPLPKSVRNVAWAAWSPRGGEIALVEQRGDHSRSLWIYDLEQRRAAKRLDFESLTYGGLDWTPDGEALLYAGRGTSGRMQLFSVPRDSGGPRQLTQDPHGLIHPQSSPDGKWIAATRIQRTREVLAIRPR